MALSLSLDKNGLETVSKLGMRMKNADCKHLKSASLSGSLLREEDYGECW